MSLYLISVCIYCRSLRDSLVSQRLNLAKPHHPPGSRRCGARADEVWPCSARSAEVSEALDMLHAYIDKCNAPLHRKRAFHSGALSCVVSMFGPEEHGRFKPAGKPL